MEYRYANSRMGSKEFGGLFDQIEPPKFNGNQKVPPLDSPVWLRLPWQQGAAVRACD